MSEKISLDSSVITLVLILIHSRLFALTGYLNHYNSRRNDFRFMLFIVIILI